MPSTILGDLIPHHVSYADRPLFSLPPRVLGVPVTFMLLILVGLSLILVRLSVFLGYSRTQKGYKCYSLTLRRQLVFVNVSFNESLPYFTTPLSSPPPDYYLPTLVPIVPP